MYKTKLFLLSSSCLTVFICLNNAYGQNEYPEELYSECVNVSSKSFCDFLFKRDTANPTNLTAMVPSNYTESTNSMSGSWNASNPPINSDLNSSYLTYNDNDNGFTIQYPSDWIIDNTKNTYPEQFNAVRFRAPDQNADLTIRILPKGDYESIKEFADKEFKQSDDYSLLAYYRNSSTLLSGKPAFKAIYLSTYTPSFDEKLSGYQSWTAKSMFMGTMVPEKKSVYAVAYFALPNHFDDHLPIVEKMIDSFQINAKGPVIQEDNSSSTEP